MSEARVGVRARSVAAALCAVASAAAFTLGACSRRHAPSVPYVPPPPPLELGTESVEWREVRGEASKLAFGPSYDGTEPPFAVVAAALGPRHWVVVIGPQEQRDDPDTPRAASKTPAPRRLFLLDRSTDKMLAARFPAREPFRAGPATVRIEGDRARVVWMDVSKAPWRAGQALLELRDATWTDVRESEVPEAISSEERGARRWGEGIAFAGDRVMAVIDRRAGKGIFVSQSSAFDSPTPSWSPWEPLGQDELYAGESEGPAFVVTRDTPPSDVAAGSPAQERPAEGATVRRFKDGKITSAPFTLRRWSYEWGSPDILLFAKRQQSGNPRYATMDGMTLSQVLLSGAGTDPWSSGLHVDAWAAHGKEVVQLAAAGEGRIVARVFSAGEAEPVLEVPAPPDILAALDRWRGPNDVRSDREICLFGGTANGRLVYSGLCFDMRERSYRAVKSRFGRDLADNCSQFGLHPGSPPLIGCRERKLEPTGDCFIHPPFSRAWGWEVIGMRSSADGE